MRSISTRSFHFSFGAYQPATARNGNNDYYWDALTHTPPNT